MSQPIQVRMLGGFSVSYGDQHIDDSTNRMKKVWLLLAYLLCNRKSVCTQENYIALLQGAGGEESADPGGKVKAMFYRVRTMLNELMPTAGHDWIVRRNGSYCWNSDVEAVLDIEMFEDLCRRAAAEEDEAKRMSLYDEALALYEGDFLPKLSIEPWVMTLNAYYHRMFTETASDALALLQQQGAWKKMLVLCEKARKIEPYNEVFHCAYMRALLALDRRSEAVQVYEEMSESLFSAFGVMPSDESRALYREACREADTPVVPTDALRGQLSESGGAGGAMKCEYDFFRLVYQMQARSIARSGEVVHIALFSLHGYRGKELPRRSLDVAMNNFEELAVNNLRQGDLVSRCSASQLVIMLPQANYENSCMVCQRLEKAFQRKYPHSPAKLHFSVQPLEPRENK